MTEFEKGYEQGYKDGMAGAALPNVNDNGDKIDGYGYAYKTDSRGEPYIHIDSVRNMLKKAADVQPVKRGEWKYYKNNGIFDIYKCSVCGTQFNLPMDVVPSSVFCFCPHCGAEVEDGDTDA